MLGRKCFVLVPLLALMASFVHAQGVVPEVDTAEVIRRGDSIEIVGEGPRDNDAMAFFQAMAPPADDSGKWFVTVISQKDCKPCEALKADFRKAPELLAFVASPDETKAWAHYSELLSNETLQQEKIKHYKFSGYPTLVIQPPRNGSWGDPSTVVFQVTGYDGNAKALAGKIRSAVQAYSAKMRALGFPKEPEVNAVVPPMVSGYTQAGPLSKAPDFQMYGDPLPPDPNFPSQYPPASQVAPSSDIAVLIVQAVLSLFGGQWLAILLAIYIAAEKLLTKFAPLTKTTKDDELLALLTKLRKYFPNGVPSDPAPTTPVVVIPTPPSPSVQ